jgi:hypothetical protein
MSLSAGKRSKTRRRKTSVAATPAERHALSNGGELTPLECLYNLMNDESLSRMQRQAIAKRLAPYFHPKLKPIPAGQFSYNATEDEDAELAAQESERLRKILFRRFD